MIYFYRKSNDFTDILSDPILKKHIRYKIKFENHLFILFDDSENMEKLQSYVSLKYGDSIISFNSIAPDRKPVMNKDYAPEPKKITFH